MMVIQICYCLITSRQLLIAFQLSQDALFLSMLVLMISYIASKKKKNSSDQKFVKRTGKIIFSLVYVCFRLTKISYFLNFSSDENVTKENLSANAYSCVSMKFCTRQLYVKMELLLVFRSTFSWQYLKEKMNCSMSYCSKNKRLVNKIFYIFLIISCRKGDRRIEEFFFSFMVIDARSLY